LDLNRLSKGEQILGGAALLLLVTSFLSFWSKYEIPGIEGSTPSRGSAWSASFNFLTKLGLILTIVALILILAKAAGGLDNVNLPAPLGLIYLGVAGLAALLIILTAIIGPQETVGAGGLQVNLGDAGYEVSRGPLLYVGALLALVMAAGAFLHFSEGDATARPIGGPAVPPQTPPGT
jgi:hypothetical protein